MTHTAFLERTIYCETGNGSSECVSFFISYLICPGCLLFILVLLFMNRFLLDIVYDAADGQKAAVACPLSGLWQSEEDRV